MFGLAFTNKGNEAVRHFQNASALIPAPAEKTDKDIKELFRRSRDRGIASRKAKGYEGEDLAAGETKKMIVPDPAGKDALAVIMDNESLDQLNKRKIRLYVLQWASWETMSGVQMETEKCQWLEPPPRPNNTGMLIWNDCDQY